MNVLSSVREKLGKDGVPLIDLALIMGCNTHSFKSMTKFGKMISGLRFSIKPKKRIGAREDTTYLTDVRFYERRVSDVFQNGEPYVDWLKSKYDCDFDEKSFILTSREGGFYPIECVMLNF